MGGVQYQALPLLRFFTYKICAREKVRKGEGEPGMRLLVCNIEKLGMGMGMRLYGYQHVCIVEPPNNKLNGGRILVLCQEVVPISEVLASHTPQL